VPFLGNIWVQDGALSCGYYDKTIHPGPASSSPITRAGTTSTGAFFRSCTGVVLSESNAMLGANCSTTPFDYEAKGWIWSALPLAQCIGRNPALGLVPAARHKLLSQISQCGLQLAEGGSHVRLDCEGFVFTWTLGEFLSSHESDG
jgi:hypothetical protein